MYRGVHECAITEELLQQLMYNALTIGVFGMIESKRKDVNKHQQQEVEVNE